MRIYTELNEREFRSFFDKIIQVPFSMPGFLANICNIGVDGITKDVSLMVTDFAA